MTSILPRVGILEELVLTLTCIKNLLADNLIGDLKDMIVITVLFTCFTVFLEFCRSEYLAATMYIRLLASICFGSNYLSVIIPESFLCDFPQLSNSLKNHS